MYWNTGSTTLIAVYVRRQWNLISAYCEHLHPHFSLNVKHTITNLWLKMKGMQKSPVYHQGKYLLYNIFNTMLWAFDIGLHLLCHIIITVLKLQNRLRLKVGTLLMDRTPYWYHASKTTTDKNMVMRMSWELHLQIETFFSTTKDFFHQLYIFPRTRSINYLGKYPSEVRITRALLYMTEWRSQYSANGVESNCSSRPYEQLLLLHLRCTGSATLSSRSARHLVVRSGMENRAWSIDLSIQYLGDGALRCSRRGGCCRRSTTRRMLYNLADISRYALTPWTRSDDDTCAAIE